METWAPLGLCVALASLTFWCMSFTFFLSCFLSYFVPHDWKYSYWLLASLFYTSFFRRPKNDCQFWIKHSQGWNSNFSHWCRVPDWNSKALAKNMRSGVGIMIKSIILSLVSTPGPINCCPRTVSMITSWIGWGKQAFPKWGDWTDNPMCVCCS